MKLRKIVSLLGKEPRKKVKVKSLSRVRPRGLQPPRLLCPWEFSRQGYWSGLPFPSPGDLPDPGIEPRSTLIAGRHRQSLEARVYSQVLLPNAEAFTELGVFPGKLDQRLRSVRHSPASLCCFGLLFPGCNVALGGCQTKKTLLPSEPEDRAGPSDFISRRPAGGAPEARPPLIVRLVLNGRGRERPRSVGSRQQLQRLSSCRLS